ncbi:hypothetical protein D3C76_1133320 [compost metagenome]
MAIKLLALDAFNQRQTARERGIPRDDHVCAAAQQQPFIGGAQAGVVLAYDDFQHATALTAQGMDLPRHRLNLIILGQRKDNRGGLCGAGFIKE